MLDSNHCVYRMGIGPSVFWFPVRTAVPVLFKDSLECFYHRVSRHDYQQVSVHTFVGLMI